MKIQHWEMVEAGQPLRAATRDVGPLAPGDALVRVAGCGVCHTDIGFLFDGVKTRHELPLTLGHEVSGMVEDAGAEGRSLVGAEVIVPAVMPCRACELCLRGRGSICKRQVFPGNDIHGGFASHLVVPAQSLCRVPRGTLPASVELADLAVVADAVTTPYQSIQRSGLTSEDTAVFVGAGGVGAFGVQIAAALGAWVAAIDVDPARLELAAAHGAHLTLNPLELEPRELKRAIQDQVRACGRRTTEWRLFETSGTRAGQETIFSLLVPGAYIGVIGFTREHASVPLSHLMAFDARAEGNWGAAPEIYPDALQLIVEGKVLLAPFIDKRPLSMINQVLDDVHSGRQRRRPVLIPDHA